MVNIRVVETLQHVTGKLLQLLHREIERLHEFVELHLMDVLRDDLMVAGITDDVHTTQEGHRRKHGVRTIEQRHLTLVVRLLRGYEQHMQTGLVSGELLGHFLRSLDDPEVEVLGLYDEVVAVTDLFLYLLDLIAGEARHDTVYESGIDTTGLVEPLLKVGTEVPQFDVFIDAVLQDVTIEEDQLTGEDNQSLRHIAVEGLITTVQQLYEFAGIAAGRCIFELTVGIEGDTGLSGVRDDGAGRPVP